MRFATLGSGSAGNATIVAAGGHALLVDCGLSTRQVERRLETLEWDPSSVAAIVLTHEHDDHVGGAATFSAKYGIPVYLTPGTRRGAGDRLNRASTLVEFAPESEIRIREFTLAPAIVPHDACEPCQFVVSSGEYRLGILTDVGSITPHLLRHFEGLDALVLEFNHDRELLANGPYPAGLRARIAGPYGHLSNNQADDLLARLDTRRLRHIVAAHLSEKTNTPALVEALLEERVPAHVSRAIAMQHAPTPWYDLTELAAAWLQH